MSSPSRDNEEPSSTSAVAEADTGGVTVDKSALEKPRPPAKRRLSNTVIEISDTDSDDSDVCAVNSYQASADEVKRIRGDEYSSSSSSSDYSSDSESPWEDDSVLLEEEKLEGKLVRAHLNPRANRMDDPKLNPNFKAEEFLERLSLNWKDCKDHKSEDVTLTAEPFRLCRLHNLLANPEIINNIVDDMNTLDWSRKKMDLYEFHQTADLASLTWQRSIRGIYELLKTEVMSLVSKVTGLELRSVSASCSLYGPGDHLLVHDDLLADRRVAFILYLAPWRRVLRAVENGGGANHADNEECDETWRPEMGGALELLACDEDGRPRAVQRRVYPSNNTLAFFKVGTDSFHQVGEVLSMELPRLSINGWFHGPAAAAPAPPPASPILDPPSKPHNEVVLLNEWVEPTYMSPRNRAQIQAQMERDSEASLRDFLQPAKYQELCAALKDEEVEWELAGPAHQRRHHRVRASWLAAAGARQHAVVPALERLLRSAAFVRLLADCTDLALHTVDATSIQRWQPGDFTLVPPRAHYQRARLELLLYLAAPARALSGGCTTYLAPEDDAGAPSDGALVTVPPVSNALSLVYCDKGAASFTKYLARLAAPPHTTFYIVSAVYSE
ncbi:prolyl 3-hydroxylase sudestada1 [Plodia interpunctella]|uniref:prolyl 3-hydroxylase sudestada1 n=1 Tax=Plodia interpunctella TaxID=58824 RepID=UPI002368D17F|nr:prolyl 3-hydroxylase sudestada1 [Plodia interpunctella]